MAERASGISASFVLSFSVIGGFVLLGLFVVRSNFAEVCINKLCSDDQGLTTVIIGFTLVAAVVISIGKFTYASYIDEDRDVAIANLITQNSLSIYTDNVGMEAVNDSLVIRSHDWAQNIHPPGHYIPAALLASNEYSRTFFRFFYFLPLIFVALLAIRHARAAPETQLITLVMGVLIFSATYLRNYTLIRVGDELFPFLAFSGFLFVFYGMAKGEALPRFRKLLLAFLLFVIAFFSKFSVLVAMLALCAALVLGAMIYRERVVFRLALISVGILVGTILLYYAIFDGTIMFGRQVESYGARILESLRLVSREELIEGGVKPAGRSPIISFFFTLPFRYGPLLILAAAGYVYSVLAKKIQVERNSVILLLFLVIGLLGVLLVNPRAQYTAPLMLGLAFFLARMLIELLHDRDLVTLAFVAFLFAVSEVLMMSFA